MADAADKRIFWETGLSASDTVSADTYRVGLDTNDSGLVNVGHLDALNQDVVWYVAYENFTVKDLKAKVDTLSKRHQISNDGKEITANGSQTRWSK